MTRRAEATGTLAFCGLALLILAFISDEGNALAVLALLGVPLAVFLGLAYLAGEKLSAGWLSGTATAFLAVAVFEAVWEVYLYKGPNSMPGFVFLFMSAPLSVVGLAPARAIVRRLNPEHVLLRALLSFLLVFLMGSSVVLFSLAKQGGLL